MNMIQLKALIKKGESEVLEFKKSTAQLSAAMQTICAFLNSNAGGTVLIGVTDDGKIVGQKISNVTKKEIASEISKVEPHAKFDIDFVSVKPDLSVIVVMVGPGDKAPYVYDGRPFLRSQSTTRKMPQEIYDQLLQNRQAPTVAWECLTTNTCTIKDLDTALIKTILTSGIEAGRLTDIATQGHMSNILEKLELIIDGKLTNAAVILFCNKKLKQFTQSEIKVARFLGTDKSEFLDHKVYRGNVFELYEYAMNFLNTHLPIAGRIENSSSLRIETPAIPYKVLREALVNALCHRDYSARDGSIDIAIYDDRVEIDSSGRLVPSITINDLTKSHRSYTRNKLIAHIFFIAKLIERWGRGIQDMINVCKETGNPPPQFKETSGSFMVILPLKEPMRQFARTNQ
jgi:ATP-dependent DNA helicase RecG